jgi:HEAT repeat protein
MQSNVMLLLIFLLIGTGMSRSHDLTNATVKTLLRLLESPNEKVRESAASELGVRFRNPNVIMLNGPVGGIETNVPPEVIKRLFVLAESDNALGPRLSGVQALAAINYRTNTALLLSRCLTNDATLVRIRAVEALTGIKEYRPLILSTLRSIFLSSAREDELWQAAFAASRLGATGTNLLPQLNALTEHTSSKVRTYAKEAIGKINTGSDPGKPL